MTAIAEEACPLPARPVLHLVDDRYREPVPEAPSPVRVTGRCTGCAAIYITDLAWRRADAEQLEAWTVHGIGPHAGNGLCVPCTAPPEESGVDVAEAVIEQLTVEVAQKVAAHLAGEEVGLVKSRHVLDLSEDSDLDVVDVVIATYGPPPGDWTDERACADREDLIFAEKRPDLAKAKEMCGGCPVRAQCLDYALRQPNSASAGVWGGMHQRNLRDTRWAISREAYRRNGMKSGSFGAPVPLED